MLSLKLDKWLYSKLSIPGSNGVYNGFGPIDAVYPIVIFNVLSSNPVYEVGTREIMQRFEVSILTVTSGTSFAPLEPIADAIAARIHAAGGSITGITIVASRKGSDIKKINVLDGVSYYSLGNIFTIYAQTG